MCNRCHATGSEREAALTDIASIRIGVVGIEDTYDIDKLIKTAQGSHELSFSSHDYPDPASDALVNKLQGEDLWSCHCGSSGSHRRCRHLR